MGRAVTAAERRRRALLVIAYAHTLEHAGRMTLRAFRPRRPRLPFGATFSPPHDCSGPVCRTCGRTADRTERP